MAIRWYILVLLLSTIGICNGQQQNPTEETDGCTYFASWKGIDSIDCGLNRTHPCLTLDQYFSLNTSSLNVACIDGDGVKSSSQSISITPKKGVFRRNIHLRGIGEVAPFVYCREVFYLSLEAELQRIRFNNCSFSGIVSTLSVDRCQFTADEQIFNVDFKTQISLSNSNFYCNKKSRGVAGVIFQTFVLSSAIHIGSSDFSMNTAISILAPIIRSTNISNNQNIAQLMWNFRGLFTENQVYECTVRHNSIYEANFMDSGPLKRNSRCTLLHNRIIKLIIVSSGSICLIENHILDSKLTLGPHSNSSFINNTFTGLVDSYHQSRLNFFEGNLFKRGWIIQSDFSADAQDATWIFIDKCQFINRGIIIPTLAEGGKINITNSQFEGLTRPSRSEDEVLPLIKINFITGKMKIENCTFMNNYASESGGGISAVTSYKASKPLIEVIGCEFHNLFSYTTGGAIFSRINIAISNTHFWNNSAPFQGDSLWSTRTMLLDNVNFATGTERGEITSLPMNGSTVDMKCPRWHIIQEGKVADGLHFTRCSHCPGSEYSTGNGEMVNGTVLNPTCVKLPFGIQQVNEQLIVDPNFWCLPNRTIIECYRCPREYCPSKPHPFNEENACANNRTGILCGDCQKGLTVSLLGSRCVDDTKCSWFWITPFILKSVGFFVIYWLIPIGGTNSEWYSIMYVVQTLPLLTPSNQISLLSMPFAPTSTPTVSNFTPCIVGGMTQKHIVAIQLVSSVLAPLMAFLGFTITYLRKKWKKDKRFTVYMEFRSELEENSPILEEEEKQVNNRSLRYKLSNPSEWMRVTLQSMLLVYSTLLANSFQLFWCISIDSENRLFIDANHSCNSTEDKFIFVFFMILLVPFPVVLLALWAKLKKEEKRRKKESGEKLDFHSQSLIFLQSMYRNEFGWWESYSYARRTVQIFIFVLTSGHLRTSLLFFTCILFLILQGWSHPMATHNGNRLELLCLACLTLIAAEEMNESPTKVYQTIATLIAIVSCLFSWLAKKLPINRIEFLFV